MGRFLHTLRSRREDHRSARANRARGTHCFYCGQAFTDEPSTARTVDHRVPRSAGGTDGLVNLVFACFACNQRKADRSEHEFLASEWLSLRREPRPDRQGP